MNNFTDSRPQFSQADCEEHVAAIWAELLQYRDTISSDTNFFEIGGDSLAVMMMLFQISEAYRLDIQAWEFVEQPTLGALCARIHLESSRNGAASRDRPITNEPLEGQI